MKIGVYYVVVHLVVQGHLHYWGLTFYRGKRGLSASCRHGISNSGLRSYKVALACTSCDAAMGVAVKELPMQGVQVYAGSYLIC